MDRRNVASAFAHLSLPRLPIALIDDTHVFALSKRQLSLLQRMKVGMHK